MAVSRIGFGKSGGAAGPSATVGYNGIGSGGMDTSIQRNNDEIPEQFTTHSASATITLLGCNIRTNTIATAATFRLRVATANGNNLVSVTASTTGWFEDAVSSDTLADGNKIDVAINCGSGVGTFVCYGGAATLTTASGGAHMYLQAIGAISGSPPNLMNFQTNDTRYMPIAGQWASITSANLETTETNISKVRMRAAGTWSNLQSFCASNARLETVSSRLNGGAGTQTLSIGGSGSFEDTTHTDTIAAGDTANYSSGSVSGGFSTNLSYIGSKIAATGINSDVVSAAITSATGCTNAVTYYGPYGYYGTSAAETVEANAQISTPYTATFSNLRTACTTYSLGSPVTFSFRNNAGAGNQTVSVNATGVFEDTTHSDAVTAGNKYCYTLSSPGATSGIVLSWFAATQTGSQSFAGSITETAAATDTISATLQLAATIVEAANAVDTISAYLSNEGDIVEVLNAQDRISAYLANASYPSRMGFGHYQGGAGASMTVGYLTIGNAGMSISLQSSDREDYARIRNYSDGALLKNLGWMCVINTLLVSTSMTFRQNGVDGNLQTTIPASSTGWFEDSIHNDLLVDGTYINVAIVSGADSPGGGNLNVANGFVTLVPLPGGAGNYYTALGQDGAAPPFAWTFNGDTLTYFLPFATQCVHSQAFGEFSETYTSQQLIRSQGTFTKLQTNILTNGRISTSTINLRVNSFDGTNSISIPGNNSGLYIDTVSADDVDTGALVNYAVTVGVGAFFFIDPSYISMKFECTTQQYDLFSSSTTQATTCNNAVTYYGPVGLFHSANAALLEEYAAATVSDATLCFFMRCAVTTNALGIGLTYQFRNDSVNGLQSASIPAGATGIFEDTINTDTVLPGEAFNYSLSAPGAITGLVIPWFGITQILAAVFDGDIQEVMNAVDTIDATLIPVTNPPLDRAHVRGRAGVIVAGLGVPPGPKILPAYPYVQYNDDDDIQAFFGAYNAYAQAFSDWLNALHLPVYTSAPISGEALDFVAKGLYGMARPVLSFSNGEFIGPLDTFSGAEIGFAYELPTSTENLQVIDDDTFRRILTWHIQKSMGKVFNVRWLKRRIIQFLKGINGVPFNVDNTYEISVTFGPGNQVNINFNSGTWSAEDGIYCAWAGFAEYAFAQQTATFTPNASIDGTLLKAAIQSGALELPFQFTYVVNL